MIRIKCLFLIAVLIACCSIVNAQNIDRVGSYSQSGGDAFVQYFFGGTFGCVLYGENGSLTITSEYMDTTSSGNSGVDDVVMLAEGIFVYPNPAAYTVSVVVQNAVNDAVNTSLDIYDINGRQVLSKQIYDFGEEIKVDVSGLSAGTYILRVAGATAKIVKR